MLHDRFRWASAAVVLSVPGLSLATILYVADYKEHVTSLELTGSEMKVKAITPGCGDLASWLTLDSITNRLFCMDESSPNGTISSFETHADGSLSRLNTVTTLPGAVAGTLFGQGNGLAVAYYSGGSVASFDVSKSDRNTLEPVQAETYHMVQPGPSALDQDQPHPHHAIMDPSGKFLVVPDLGANLIRIYLVSNDGRLRFTALAPVITPAGSGPRHGAFLVTPDGMTYFYLVSEIVNTITGYKITYTSSSTIDFTEVYKSGSHGIGGVLDQGRLSPEDGGSTARAAEIHVSPDGRFLLVSSRNEGNLKIPSFDPNSNKEIESDPIITFSIDHSNGNLTRLQEFAAGGMVARQFSISNDGSMVAVGLQQDGRVVIIDRDAQSGMLTKYRAAIDVGYQPTCVIFKEETLLRFGSVAGLEQTPLPLITLILIFLGVGLLIFTVSFFSVRCICKGRRKLAWFLEQRKYRPLIPKDLEGEELEPTDTAEMELEAEAEGETSQLAHSSNV